MREIGETNEQNRQKRYASIMEMKLYHKWELNEMGGLGLYSRIGSHHKKAFLEDSLCHCINMYYCGNHFLTIFIVVIVTVVSCFSA